MKLGALAPCRLPRAAVMPADRARVSLRTGEERLVTIGGDEGYGAKGFPAWGIAPMATLEFTLEMLKIA